MEPIKNTFVFPIPKNSMHLTRLLMAIYVACAHFVELTASSSLSWIPIGMVKQGRMAILGFFIFSGFLITASYLRSKSFKDYLYNRILRLYPGYIVIILLCFVGLSLISTLNFQEYFTNPKTYKYLIANLSFLNFIEPSLPGVFEHNPFSVAVNGSLWTLKVEIVFYLFLPFYIWLLTKQKSNILRNLIMFITYCSSYIYVYWIDHSTIIPNHLRFPLSLQFPGLFNFFVVGIFLYFNFAWFQKNIKFIILPALILLVERILWNSLYLTPIVTGIICFFVSFKMPILQKIKIKADFSFGIYIFHYPIIQSLVALGYTSENIYLSFLLFWMLVLIAAQCSWTFIEKPLLQKKK